VKSLVSRNLRLITDIRSEPSPWSDEGRVLALLESRLGQFVPVYEVEGAGRLQYAARAHTLRHVYGYVIVNRQDGKTGEGRKRTSFALIGRLTRSQLAMLEDLCRKRRMRYDAAIVQVFPEAVTSLTRRDREKTGLVRNYPTLPRHEEAFLSAATPAFPQFGSLVKESYGVD
jgi:hypothetical protein